MLVSAPCSPQSAARALALSKRNARARSGARARRGGRVVATARRARGPGPVKVLRARHRRPARPRACTRPGSASRERSLAPRPFPRAHQHTPFGRRARARRAALRASPHRRRPDACPPTGRAGQLAHLPADGIPRREPRQVRTTDILPSPATTSAPIHAATMRRTTRGWRCQRDASRWRRPPPSRGERARVVSAELAERRAPSSRRLASHRRGWPRRPDRSHDSTISTPPSGRRRAWTRSRGARRRGLRATVGHPRAAPATAGGAGVADHHVEEVLRRVLDVPVRRDRHRRRQELRLVLVLANRRSP